MPKQYSAEFKTEVVLKTIKEDRLIKDIAEAYGVHPVTVSNWRREFFENAEQLKEKDRQIEELKQETDDEKLRRLMVEGFLSES